MSLLMLVVGAVIVLVVGEIFDFFPFVAERLIRRATMLLPADDRERYLNEWLAEVEAVPGRRFFRLIWAVRVLCRAPGTARALGQPRRPELERFTALPIFVLAWLFGRGLEEATPAKVVLYGETKAGSRVVHLRPAINAKSTVSRNLNVIPPELNKRAD